MNTQFFGREDELAQIQSHWEKIASGHVGDESVSNILVVTGNNIYEYAHNRELIFVMLERFANRFTANPHA